jgi:hypothetical protein
MEKRPSADPLSQVEEESLSVLVLRDGTELYRSYDQGARPLLELVDWFPGGIEGATVADRVVGACAARIFAHLRVGRVLGLTGSTSAESVLHAAGIDHSFRRTVTEIRNRADTGTCPFEVLSAQHRELPSLVAGIRQRLAEFSGGRPDR